MPQTIGRVVARKPHAAGELTEIVPGPKTTQVSQVGQALPCIGGPTRARASRKIVSDAIKMRFMPSEMRPYRWWLDAVDLPFLHIVDPTARQVLDRGFTTVGLLGSRYTMTGSYFVGRLRERYGLQVLVAEGEHQENVHNALYGELAKGNFLPATREKFKAAIADLIERGAQAVILGCTEFGMLIEAKDSPVPLIDTTVAHAEAAVDLALQH